MRRLALAILLPVAPLAAQHGGHAHGAPDADTLGRYPRALVEKPVPLRGGLRRLHDPVTTSSPEAQALHDQGLSYLHSFAYLEAARSFRQALRADSAIALSWLGLRAAYASLGIEEGQAARLARAESLAVHASPRERARVRLARLGRDLDGDDKAARSRRAAYKAALDSALVAWDEDPELWLLRAQYGEMEAGPGDPAPAAFYETVLARAPGHMAAHHYLIHFYEGIGRIDLALRHGEAYAASAPAIAHAQHMYGHDLRRVGRVGDAIREFTEADSIERAYYATEGVPREYDWHHPHNLTLLALSYAHQGRMREAERLLRDKAAIRPLTAWNAYYNRQSVPEFLVLRGRWTEALEAARALQGDSTPAARAAGHLWAGHALLGLRDEAGARRELDAAQRALEGGDARAARFLAPARTVLEGALGLRKRGGARRAAAARLDALMAQYRRETGPDAWIEALFGLEMVARAARDAEEWDLALRAGDAMVAHDSAYAGAHFARGRALGRTGRLDQARPAFERALALWAGADPELPEISQAREWAAPVPPRATDRRVGERR